jgi:aspartate/methionine/tyrosine aminotransferase
MLSTAGSLSQMGSYASKEISERAKSDPNVSNLSIGEPEFGPPPFLAEEISKLDLTYARFLDAAKRYEISKGMPELRVQIAEWYKRRHDLVVDPETEILVTHGGVEAMALAILATTDPGDAVVVSDPTYMLYSRLCKSLARNVISWERLPGIEYTALDRGQSKVSATARALIVNSPENPTGYVASMSDWAVVGDYVERNRLWLIHDEVYDTMSFKRPHVPCRSIGRLKENSILVNSFSKKFGVPGLRIGWLCGPRRVVDLAARLHDYLYLGVNILFENIALRLLMDERCGKWLEDQSRMLAERAQQVVNTLTSDAGFTWTRYPEGGMFAFPDVLTFFEKIPRAFKDALAPASSPSEVVALYLLKVRGVAVVPGSIYGSQGKSAVRLVLAGPQRTLDEALAKLRGAFATC